MLEIADYAGLEPAWCPGCGNFSILKALNKALAELDLEPHQILMVSGIGQAAKLPHYTRGNVFNSLHGRALSPAIGAKIANQELTVIAIGGDGDGYGEGGNHFMHSARRNHDITYLVHNNQVYGLTKGQASPTSDAGTITKTTPEGSANPLNPLLLAIVCGATFVARGFSGDPDHLTGLIKAAINHRGFSLIDILQPCVSFNHKNTFAWYRERAYKLTEAGGYQQDDKNAAMIKAQEWGEKIPLGIIYRAEQPTFEDRLLVHGGQALVRQSIDPGRVRELLNEFT